MAEPQTNTSAMPSADTIKAWMDSNPDKAGTQDFVTMKQAYDAIIAPAPNASTAGPRAAQPGVPLPPTPPVNPANALPGPRVGKDIAAMQPVAPDINYQAPIADVRAALAAEPNLPTRQAGLDRWAGFEEQRQHEQGGLLRGANDWIRAIAAGVPGGAWGDEINAGISSITPEILGGRPYNEAAALENARNKRFAYEHPVGNVVANIGGAVASAPATTIRGAGILANTGIDTLIAAIQGAGDANSGTVTDRAKAGAVDAGVTAPISLAINSALSSLGKYGRLSPEIVRAAEQLGLDRIIPAFVKAASPDVQAAGRRTAQSSLDSPLNTAWRASNDATELAAGNIANRAAGTTEVMQAPTQVGRQLAPALEATADAAQTQKGVLARQTEELLPPGVRYDVPQMRAATDEVIDARTARGAVNPEAGLGDQLGMTTRQAPDPMNGPFAHYGPGGSTWPALAGQATEIGQRIGLPNTVPREIDNAQLSHIMRGLRDDQRSIMRQDAGPWGEATFTRNLERTGELSELQKSIQTALGNKPEDIVNLALNSATIKGAGTNADALLTITNSLPPEQRVALGGGVLAKIVSDAGGSPAKMAATLESMTPEARGLLFPPGTQLAADVDALRTVAGRIGDVNALQATGSAASVGVNPMAIAGKYGGLGIGAGAALYGMHQGGYPELAAGMAGAAAGGRYGFNRFAKPYLLRAGINPAIQTGMDAARGISRGVGTQYQLPNSPPEL